MTELRIWLQTILMNNLADLRKRFLRAQKRQVRRERPPLDQFLTQKNEILAGEKFPDDNKYNTN